MPRITRLIFLALILSAGTLMSQVPDICLTREEYRLYSMINDYRIKDGLPIIPISKSMSYVAKIHARDLFHNNPDTSFCSLNSWSDKGPWIACCHSKYTPNPSCIVNKPTELANYPGEGHELVYWDSESLHPDTVIRFWISIDPARDLILNRNKWSHFNWKAIGVGMYHGYACAWFGEAIDTIAEPVLCNGKEAELTLPFQETDKSIVTSPTGRHYLIFGSFNSLQDAKKVAEKYRQDGFYQAKIVAKDNIYRISLSDHATQEEALSAKKMLGEEYKEAWITKY